MCLIDEGDRFDVLHDTKPRARKRHRCDECRRWIEPGEVYHRVVGADEYGLSTWKTCAQCEAATSWLQVTCRGFCLGAVYEDLFIHWQEEPDLRSEYLAAALAGMRRGWALPGGALMNPLPAFQREQLPEAYR